eukprot:GDKH01029066.1.p2 GENE.GDKH01029066.1~~GDKH01029066.1.p2  ORF type:complete len:152 (-),score=39.60 GDKH01029066.1:66-485(-)
MVKFIKSGRIVVILNGRFAGKKAVICKAFDNGTKERAFPHVLVAGVERAPLKVTKHMSKKKIEKRTRVKTFVKYVNLKHVMPTRYVTDIIDTKAVNEASTQAENRKETKKALATTLQQKAVKVNDNKKETAFLRTKLRF